LQEELAKLQEAVASGDRAHAQEELGDVAVHPGERGPLVTRSTRKPA